MDSRIVFYFLSVFVFASCNQTIEKASGIETTKDYEPPVEFSFEGVDELRTVSDKKMDVYFKKAKGGSGDYVYKIYDLSGRTLAAVDSSELRTDSSGRYRFTVKNLSPNTNYGIRVRAMDKLDRIEDKNAKVIYLKTLAGGYPEFDGVLRCRNMPGSDGVTSIVVDWVAPPPKSTGLTVAPESVGSYTITYCKSEYGVSCIEAPVGGGTRAIPVNSSVKNKYVITGLDAKTAYYFNVQATSKGDPSLGIDPLREKNRDYVECQTYGEAPTDIQFSGVERAEIGVAESGTDSATLYWGDLSGNINGLMAFYHPKEEGSNAFRFSHPELKKSALGAISVLDRSYTITGLKKFTEYVAIVKVCTDASDENCADGADGGQKVIFETKPRVSHFAGIKTILTDSDPGKISEATLVFEPASFTQGIFDEYRVYIVDGAKRIDVTQTTNTQKLEGEGDYDGFYLHSFSPRIKNSTLVRLRGLKENKEYRFDILPWVNREIERSPGNVEQISYTDEGLSNTKAYTPRLLVANFDGVTASCKNPTATSFSIDWETPIGFKTAYEVFIKPVPQEGNLEQAEAFWDEVQRKISTGMSTSAAETATATEGLPRGGFERRLISVSNTSYLFQSLTPDTSYHYLLRTYMFDPNTGNITRSSNASLSFCQTKSALAVYKGITANGIFAIGPKTDSFHRVNSSMTSAQMQRGVIAEKMTKTEGGEEVFVEKNIPLEVHENLSCLGKTCSKNGIVRIQIEGVELTGGVKFHHIIENDFTGQSGYRVYRFIKGSNNGTCTDPLAGGLYVMEGCWEEVTRELIKSRVSSVNSNLTYVDFVDYSLPPQLTANHEALSPELRTVYYKVLPFKNGYTPIHYSEGESRTLDDLIIKIIMPSYNQALLHPWAVNKRFCDKIGRKFDRAKGSCTYNGLGSLVRSGNENQYHLGGYLLVDRFPVGCKFSRGDSSKNAPHADNAAYLGAPKGCFSKGNQGLESNYSWNNGASAGLHNIWIGDCVFRTNQGAYSYINDKYSLNGGVGGPLTRASTGTGETAEEAPVLAPWGTALVLRNNYRRRIDPRTQEARSRLHYADTEVHWDLPDTATNCYFNDSREIAEDLASTDTQNRFKNWRHKDNGETIVGSSWVPITSLDARLRKTGAVEQRETSGVVSARQGIEIEGSQANLTNFPNNYLGETLKGDTRPLARYFATNGAKSVPITGVDPINAFNICRSFSVTHEGTELKKSLVNRKFQVAYSEHDAFSNNTDIENLEKGSWTEGGKSQSCMVSRGGETSSLSRGESGGPRFYNNGLPNGYGTEIHNLSLLSGSSIRGDLGERSKTSTEYCTSAYGVSDFIGNTGTSLADIWRCVSTNELDPTHSLFEVTAPWGSNLMYENFHNKMDQLFKPITSSDTGALCSTIYSPGLPGGYIGNIKADVAPVTNFHENSFHRYPGTEYQAISSQILTNGSDRRLELPDFEGGRQEITFGGTSYKAFNALNMIKPIDPIAQYSYRNGYDGSFFSLGRFSLGPEIRFVDDLTLGVENKFRRIETNIPFRASISYSNFNPALGLPLHCSGMNSKACRSSADAQGNYIDDNAAIYDKDRQAAPSGNGIGISTFYDKIVNITGLDVVSHRRRAVCGNSFCSWDYVSSNWNDPSMEANNYAGKLQTLLSRDISYSFNRRNTHYLLFAEGSNRPRNIKTSTGELGQYYLKTYGGNIDSARLASSFTPTEVGVRCSVLIQEEDFAGR